MPNRESFIDYLSKIVQDNATVTHYANSIDEVSQKYKNKLEPEYTSIYEISDKDIFNTIRQNIKTDSTFKDWNNSINKDGKQVGKAGFPLAAMNKYFNFLVDPNPKIKNKNKLQKIIHDNEVIYMNIKDCYNLIYFGAPGTGKSHTMNENINEVIVEENKEAYYERVTFYRDYTYANFVGTYKPTPTENNSITYEYVPGPFMRLYRKAIQDPEHKYILIIEEINRAEVASVFGDLFQLLDRDDNNESKYKIQTSEDIRKWLQTPTDDYEKLEENKTKTLSIPSNMYIWATMNSADQGVFPMDTAFKRRWDFWYMDIDSNQEEISYFEFPNVDGSNNFINWNKLRTQINGELLTYGVNEDKLLGPFFINKNKLTNANEYEVFRETFKNKVLMYLFDDAAKMKRDSLFSGIKDDKTRKQFSKICKEFDHIGVKIFNPNIYKVLIKEDNSEDNSENADNSENSDK